MNITDRLEEIEGRAGSQVLIKILSAPDGVTISDADYARRTDDTFVLVASLRAGLAVAQRPITADLTTDQMILAGGFNQAVRAVRAAITETLEGSS